MSELIVKKTKGIKDEKLLEAVRAQSEKNAADNYYLSMMTGIDIPTEEEDGTVNE